LFVNQKNEDAIILLTLSLLLAFCSGAEETPVHAWTFSSAETVFVQARRRPVFRNHRWRAYLSGPESALHKTRRPGSRIDIPARPKEA